MKPILFKSLNWNALPATVACFCLGVWACQGAEDVIKKSFQVEPGTLLVMEVDRGSIEVAPAGGNQVQIEVVRKVDRVSDSKAADIFSRHEVSFIQEGNEVRVKAQFKTPPKLFTKDHNLQVSYNVLVPKQFNLDLHTRVGSVKIGDLTGKMKLKTGAGSLKLGKIDGPVEGKTGTGSIAIKRAQIITVETGAGSITLEDAGGEVVADSHTGSIEAALTGQPKGDCRFVTGAGSIRLAVPANTAADLEMSTGAGHVESDIPVTLVGKVSKHSITGKINGGGPKLFLHTRVGSVSLKKRGVIAAEKE